MSQQENINKLVKYFFTVQLTIKLFHWNTTSYAQHMATDRFTGELLKLTDKFVELFIGRYNVKPNVDSITIFKNDIVEMLKIFAEKLIKLEKDNITDSSLLTVRDELLGEINQTLYLLQLQ
jgi:hypothetical protein